MFLMQCHKVAFFRPWYDWETLLVLTQIQTIQQQIPGQNLLIHRLSVYCRWCTVVQVARSFVIRWISFLLLQIPHLSWNHCSHFGSIVAWTCSGSGFWYVPLQYLGSAAYLLLKTHYTFYNLSRITTQSSMPTLYPVYSMYLFAKNLHSLMNCAALCGP